MKGRNGKHHHSEYKLRHWKIIAMKPGIVALISWCRTVAAKDSQLKHLKRRGYRIQRVYKERNWTLD